MAPTNINASERRFIVPDLSRVIWKRHIWRGVMQWCTGLLFSPVSIVTPVFHTHLRLSNNLSEWQASEAIRQSNSVSGIWEMDMKVLELVVLKGLSKIILRYNNSGKKISTWNVIVVGWKNWSEVMYDVCTKYENYFLTRRN